MIIFFGVVFGQDLIVREVIEKLCLSGISSVTAQNQKAKDILDQKGTKVRYDHVKH